MTKKSKYVVSSKHEFGLNLCKCGCSSYLEHTKVLREPLLNKMFEKTYLEFGCRLHFLSPNFFVLVEVEEVVLNCRNSITLRTSLRMTWRRLMTTWLCPSRVDFAYAGTKPDPSPQIVLHGPQFSHHYY